MKYELTTENGIVYVSIDSDLDDVRSAILYEGSEENVAIVRRWLKSQIGLFGHLIGDITTKQDLYRVMNRTNEFKPKFVSGNVPSATIHSGIPDDAVT